MLKLSILSRRGLLVGAGTGLLLPSAFAADTVPTPNQTEGPFYLAGFPADMDNDLVQVRGQQARAMGEVLHLRGRVIGVDGRLLAGTLVEVWQCDAQGLYDHPRQSGRDRRDVAFQGYGRIMADADGRYSFRTLKPVAYPGRTPHIHLKAVTGDGRLLIPGRALCDSWGLFNGTELRFDGLIRIEEASDECAAWNYANGLHERRASRSERAMF